MLQWRDWSQQLTRAGVGGEVCSNRCVCFARRRPGEGRMPAAAPPPEALLHFHGGLEGRHQGTHLTAPHVTSDHLGRSESRPQMRTRWLRGYYANLYSVSLKVLVATRGHPRQVRSNCAARDLTGPLILRRRSSGCCGVQYLLCTGPVPTADRCCVSPPLWRFLLPLVTVRTLQFPTLNMIAGKVCGLECIVPDANRTVAVQAPSPALHTASVFRACLKRQCQVST